MQGIFIIYKINESKCQKLARYQLSFLTFLGFTIMCLLRFNLSLAIVVMVRDTEQSFVANNASGDYVTLSEDTCYATENTNLTGRSLNREVRYDWSTVDQGQS